VDPTVSSSIPSSSQVRSTASPSASRGDEGMGSTLDPAFAMEVGAEGFEGVSSPRCVTSPARGPVLTAHLERRVRASAAMACVLLHAGWCLPCVGILCLPPPTCGRCSEFDGRPLLSDGGGENTPFVCSVQYSGSWENICSSTFSPAGKSRPSLSASSWHVQSLANSGICSTSKVRPFLRPATTICVYTVASGPAPASVQDGGSLGLWLDGGKRDGLDCFVLSFNEVYSAYTRDPYIIFLSTGVLCKNLYCHRLLLMSCFHVIRGAPSSKKKTPTLSLLLAKPTNADTPL
jgi:hypothetical protein